MDVLVRKLFQYEHDRTKWNIVNDWNIAYTDMKKFISATIAAALIYHPAHATVIIPSTNVVFTAIYNDAPAPGYDLNITYDVPQTGSLYEYDYTLNTSPAEDITSFSIGGALDPINTAGLTITATGGAVAGTNSMSVAWSWGIESTVTNVFVSFTSPIAPEYATFTTSDDDLVWTAPPPIPAPVPEPSSLAIVAASVSVFGYGLFRYRRAIKSTTLKPKTIS